MAIDIDPDWWKTLFDEIYLITDARSVCDESLTRREIDVICELLPLEVDHEILDLCGGQGRHTFELCRRGFRTCTIMDYSRVLIDLAAATAERYDYPVDCIRCDARKTELKSESFDHILILGNSLGYIQEPEADVNILTEALRLLRPGGWLLVDVTDGSAVKNAFIPNAWHEIGDDTVVCRQRELRGESISAREVVLSKNNGLIRDRAYAVRLYDSASLSTLFGKAGFRRININKNFSPHQSDGDYGFMNKRMMATGQK
jgi:D-alanine-D-alanine ligase